MIDQQRLDRRQWPGISYVLLLGESRGLDQSPIQGFSFAMLAKTPVIRSLLRLPSTVAEFDWTRNYSIAARSRAVAPYRIFPLDVAHADHIAQQAVAFPFTCVVSDIESVDKAEEILRAIQQPVLHVTTAAHERVLSLSQLDRPLLLTHFREVISFLRARDALINMPELPMHPADWPSISLPIASHHSVSLPNELALFSLQVETQRLIVTIQPRRQFTGSLGDANRPYVQAIAGSAAILRDFRDTALPVQRPAPVIDLILASSSFLHSGQRPTLIDDAATVVEALAAQQDYPTLLLPTSRLQRLLETPAAHETLRIRHAELELFATILGAASAGTCAPTLLLPPTVNRTSGRLRDLSNCIQGNNSESRMYSKLSRIARSAGTELLAALEPELQALVNSSRGGIKLVSDAPLELLPLGDLPLCLQRECSRITATPGNLLVKQVLKAEVIPYTAASFGKVLILRSYGRDDPIRDVLENAVTEWLSHTQHHLDVRWRDVNTPDEVIAALNAYDGEIVVIDMHGRHANAGDYGSLIVGNQDFNVWTLRARAHIPAIVVLSACETHAVGASHATVANGFLDVGAHTVLATLTPVGAAHSAYFIGRLLFHVAERIPLIGTQPGAVRWSELMLDLLRRMYLFDVVRLLRVGNHLKLTEQQADEVLNVATRTIAQTDWFDHFLVELATASGCSLARARALHLRHAFFTDTLEYVQLGSPEHLLILGSIAG